MKRLLLAAPALAVLSIGADARDDRLPAHFVGDWCLAEHTADHLAFYRRGRCANPNDRRSSGLLSSRSLYQSRQH
jgi:hypothetical protein